MKSLMRQIAICLGLIGAAALAAAPAFAAEPYQSITASPSSVKLDVAAGTTTTGSITITNTGQTAYPFTVSASPFSVSGEDYEQSFTPRPDLIDASKWLSFPETSFTAVPREVVPVSYRVKVPADAAPGGYYAAIFAEAKSASSGQAITAHKRVGVLMYFTVAGEAVSGGKLLSFTVPAIHTSAPLTTTMRIENTGNVHFDVDETVEISDVFGNTKARIEETHLVFPGSTRKLEVSWAKAPAFGIFKVTGTISYLGKTQNLPTRYTLMLSSTAFVVMFLAAVAIVVYFFLTRKRRRNVIRRRK